jgi:mitochondrial enoyl-[acyl-carrier protein] reductase / trans-2-enoyl-CoA reductase
MKSRYLVFQKTGQPQDVLELAERELAPLKPDEVRMAVHYAPINPADINFIQGNYGRPSHPPAIPGHEAAGVVTEVGSEVTSLAVGDPVMPLLGAACWAEHLTAEAQFFAKLPYGIDLAQAAMLRINPVTAWHLLHHFVTLESGDWILQNAANSGVGRAVIQVAKHLGIRTLNLVRRAELIPELKALGADVVLLDDDDAVKAAKDALGKDHARLAGNAVGSDSAIRLMEMLSPGGQLVTYGAMSRRSLKVPNKFLIFKDIQLRGLWVTRWLESATPDELFDVLRPLAEMTANGQLHTAVDQCFSLSDHQSAIARATQDCRGGKVLFKLV